MRVRVLLIAFLQLAGLLTAQQPAPLLPDWVSIEPNIPYDQYKETVLDIFQPKALSKRKRPGVLVIHAGGWVSGNTVHLTILMWREKSDRCVFPRWRGRRL
jgi:acetyl esterase/lipase